MHLIIDEPAHLSQGLRQFWVLAYDLDSENALQLGSELSESLKGLMKQLFSGMEACFYEFRGFDRRVDPVIDQFQLLPSMALHWPGGFMSGVAMFSDRGVVIEANDIERIYKSGGCYWKDEKSASLLSGDWAGLIYLNCMDLWPVISICTRKDRIVEARDSARSVFSRHGEVTLVTELPAPGDLMRQLRAGPGLGPGIVK